MKPKIGDKIILVNGAGKCTHNITKISKVLGKNENIWQVEDQYRVPLSIVHDGKNWVQVL